MKLSKKKELELFKNDPDSYKEYISNLRENFVFPENMLLATITVLEKEGFDSLETTEREITVEVTTLYPSKKKIKYKDLLGYHGTGETTEYEILNGEVL